MAAACEADGGDGAEPPQRLLCERQRVDQHEAFVNRDRVRVAHVVDPVVVDAPMPDAGRDLPDLACHLVGLAQLDTPVKGAAANSLNPARGSACRRLAVISPT
jgi:hypothetical protein